MKTKTNTSSRLLKYSVAAGAATVAGTASSAISVFDNGGSGWSVDLNELLSIRIDGATTGETVNRDFAFRHTSSISSGYFYLYRFVEAHNSAGGNRVSRSVFSDGQVISNGNVTAVRGAMTSNGVGLNGWPVPGTGYVGLKFVDGTAVNYGWAEVTLNAKGPSQTLTVDRFGVEMTPGVGITAGAIPEPSTLVFLLAGATGLYYIRNRKKTKQFEIVQKPIWVMPPRPPLFQAGEFFYLPFFCQ